MVAGTKVESQATGWKTEIPAEFSLSGAQVATAPQRVFGDSFYAIDEGSAGGTNRWVKTVANSGTVSLGNGTLDFSTGGVSNGEARYHSAYTFPMLAGVTYDLRATAKFVGGPASGSIREIGFWITDNDYFYFILDGATWLARMASDSGVQEQTISTALAGNTFSDLQLLLSNDQARFFIDNQPAARFASFGRALPLIQNRTASPLLRIRCIANGSTENNLIVLSNVSVYGYGIPAWTRTLRINQASGSIAIFKGIGELVGVYVASAVGQDWKLTDDAGTTIFYQMNGDLAVPHPGYMPLIQWTTGGLKWTHNSGASADEIYVHYRT